MPHVTAFPYGDTRVAAELPCQLAIPHVYGDDCAGPSTQNAVGKPASRGAHVQDDEPAHIDTERFKDRIEFQAAAADEGKISGRDVDRRVGSHQGSGLVDDAPCDSDYSGHDQPACPIAAGSRAAID